MQVSIHTQKIFQKPVYMDKLLIYVKHMRYKFHNWEDMLGKPTLPTLPELWELKDD